MKYLKNSDNPAGDGWYDDAEADVLLEHGTGWETARAPKDHPNPTVDAPPHPDGRGAPAVPPDPDGLVDAGGRPIPAAKPAKPARKRTSSPSGGGNPDNGGDAGQEH